MEGETPPKKVTAYVRMYVVITDLTKECHQYVTPQQVGCEAQTRWVEEYECHQDWMYEELSEVLQ